MNLAGHGPKYVSKHVCLIITWTGQQGPVLYKGDEGVSDAARPPEGDPTEVGGLSASSLPWSIDRPAWMQDSPLNSQRKWFSSPTLFSLLWAQTIVLNLHCTMVVEEKVEQTRSLFFDSLHREEKTKQRKNKAQNNAPPKKKPKTKPNLNKDKIYFTLLRVFHNSVS